MHRFSTPILYLIFNRPNLVRETFERIREMRPRQLFIAADGPRNTHLKDDELCQECRQYILDQIDWDCDVRTLFRDRNLGCGLAVSSAISWFFEDVDQGIILEDDCLAHPSFFRFCESLLIKYERENQVMHIAGCNMNAKAKSNNPFFFGIHNHVWGWATWKRAWELYDYNITANVSFEKITEFVADHISKKEFLSWEREFESLSNGYIDTWDYQWTFSIWYNSGLSILPRKNLIKNLGIGENATHTKHEDFRKDLKIESIDEIPLEIDLKLSIDKIYIQNREKKMLPGTNIFSYLKDLVRNIKRRIFSFAYISCVL